MTDRSGLAGSVGVVTGAAGLLGAAVTRALVTAGSHVVAADLPGPALAAFEADLGAAVTVVETDVTTEAQVEHLFARAAQVASRPLDYVFNNAGVEGPVGPLADLDLAQLRRTVEVNVVGAASVLKHSVPHVGPGSRIVQTGSTAATAGAPHMAPYVMSKHAVLGLTRTASRELADRGVRVTALLPGPIEGPMMDRISAGRTDSGASSPQRSASSGLIDGARLATVDEIVEAALFLLGTDSSFVAGTGLLVDGGRSA